MTTKNVLVLQAKQIRDWRIIALCLFGLCAYLGHALKNTANEVSVHIPPQISQGATLKPGEVPKANLYIFTHYLFQKLSTWEDDGSKEGLGLINSYRYFLTSDFKVELEDIFNAKTAKGETRNRSRTVREANAKGFTPNLVYKVSDKKWVVKLDLRIIEKIDDTVIKDIILRYPMVVVLDNTHPDLNEWGLKLAGFDSVPRKILVKDSK